MSYTTIDNPGLFFNTVLYTGANKSITGVNFQPDWVWIKERDSGYHAIFDSIRGVTKILSSNVANAESTQSDTLTAFGTDGFTLGADSSNYVGGSSTNTVSWNWKANGTGSSNSDGSISSTVSVNTTAGFSIVSYTGNGSQPSTVGHGLGAIPEVVLVKPRSVAYSWCMYHKSTGNTHLLYLDTTGAASSFSVWNSTSPTSSVFTVNDNQVNKSGETHIAYCFKEIKGYSKFGSYTGNGNADGTFVYTGFKPAFTILKKSSGTDNWVLHDNKRSDVPNANVNDQVLYPNASDAELSSSTRAIDTVSNGFKCRGSGGNINASGSTYIYMAFAEEPFVTEGTKAAGTAR